MIYDLISEFKLDSNALGHLTSSVQFGFIIGTLCFAILTIADRYSPSKVFMISAFFGAFFNMGTILHENSFTSLIALRFLTGFFLAGIYPVGMKIAADYYQKGLGKSLGYLVGALVLGTASPHLLKNMSSDYHWESVIITTSILAVFGGLLMVFSVPDGPYRKPSKGVNFSGFLEVFKNRKFRGAAFGYFGHMWELYAFWAFVPVMLKIFNEQQSSSIDIPMWSFLIIGIGGLACVLGGLISMKFGTKKTAFYALLFSCICCLISPWVFTMDSEIIFLSFLLFWGMVVIADSPLFSTLVANNSNPQIKGTALTIVNCIGFAITIISIQLISALMEYAQATWIFSILAVGPLFGLFALSKEN